MAHRIEKVLHKFEHQWVIPEGEYLMADYIPIRKSRVYDINPYVQVTWESLKVPPTMAKIVQTSVAESVFNAGNFLFMICDDNVIVQAEGRNLETGHFP